MIRYLLYFAMSLSFLYIIFCLFMNTDYGLERLVFLSFHNSKSTNHPLKRNISFEDFSLEISTNETIRGWVLYEEEAVDKTQTVIITPGSAGTKSHNLILAEQLFAIYQCRIVSFDYPGHGSSTGVRSMENAIETLKRVSEIKWSHDNTNNNLQKRIWVTNCSGSVFLFKCYEKYQTTLLQKDVDKIVVVNGMINPCAFGVQPLPNFLLCFLSKIILKRNHYHKVDGEAGLISILENRISIKALHWRKDPFVILDHGHMIRDYIGNDNFMIFDSGKHYRFCNDLTDIIKFLH